MSTAWGRADLRARRVLGWVALSVALGSAAFVAVRPRLREPSPGPLAPPHAALAGGCAACHAGDGRAEARCGACHVAEGRSARRGHEGVTCAACHAPHGPHEGGRAGAGGVVAWRAGAVLVEEGPHPPRGPGAGQVVTTPREGACAACHDAARLDDPARACLGRACAGEHGALRSLEGQAARAAVEAALAGVPAVPDAPRVPSPAARDAFALVATASGSGVGALVLGRLGAALAARRRRRGAASALDPLAAVAGGPPAGARRVLPVVDATRCLGCGACVAACAFDVLAVERHLAVVARPDACCGATTCATVCPNGSLTLGDAAGVGAGRGTPSAGLALGPGLESLAVPGLYVAGEATGVPLIKNALAQGRAAVEHLAPRLRARARGGGSLRDIELDVVVVGAGPAGLAAALAAKDQGLRAAILERATLASSVRSFPRGKIVHDPPLDVPLVGPLWLGEATKEEVLAQWTRIVRREGLDLREGVRVVGAHPVDGPGGERVFEVAFEAGGRPGILRAAHVVVAVGSRGEPRALDAAVDAAIEARVASALSDARAYAGQRVLVVGLGDAALEAAQALAAQAGTHVTLVHRGAGFTRGRARNVAAVEALVADGRVALRLGVRVAALRAAPGAAGDPAVRVELAGASAAPRDHALPRPDALVVDRVLTLLGGRPPAELFARLGLGGELSPSPRVPPRAAGKPGAHAETDEEGTGHDPR